MVDALLKNRSAAFKITAKTIIALALAVTAAVLPQIVHFFGGSEAGSALLPMYAPVLVAGCILGPLWGACAGAASPLVSFALTSAFMQTAMPAAGRLPYMVAELAVFALVSGLFSKKIERNALFAFPAVICAQVAGRLTYFAAATIFGQSPAAVWSVIECGLAGLYIQAAIVPALIIILHAAVKHDGD